MGSSWTSSQGLKSVADASSSAVLGQLIGAGFIWVRVCSFGRASQASHTLSSPELDI